MNGVFINLTDKDIIIKSEERSVVILANVDLVTPIRQIIKTNGPLSGIISTQLADNDIHYLQATHWFNTNYNKILRSEQNIMLSVPLVSPYIKYPFTQSQIDKINSISNGRTRLLILTKEDAEYWSSGNFKECPFRNYRLFTNIEDSLVEYPIPSTYLDAVVGSMSAITKKIGFN